MSEQLTPRERAQFFRQHFGVADLNEPFKEERKAGGHILGLKREYRTAGRALSPAELDAYFAALHARIDELEAGATA